MSAPRWRRALRVWRRRGPFFPLRLARDTALPRLGHRALWHAAPPLRRGLLALAAAAESLTGPTESRSGAESASQEPAAGDGFLRWEALDIDDATRVAVDQARRELDDASGELMLGRIDNDGRLLATFGPLPGFQEVCAADFVPRYRFPLEVVLGDGKVLVRKSFAGDGAAYRRELRQLGRLAGDGVAPVFRADDERRVLTRGLVAGDTVRDLLVRAGARILSVDTDGDPELAELDGEARLAAVWRRGQACFAALPAGFLDRLEGAVDRLHARGVTGFSLTFGNVVVGVHGEPRFIDFDKARHHGSRGSYFAYRRDQDRDKLRRIWGLDVLTEGTARAELAAMERRLGGWYAPIDFGRGLTVGGHWSIDAGSGRWDFLNRRVVAPLVDGRRVLDLGCNNGVLPLLMLRSGARSVTACELSPDFAAAARLVHRVFEWRDLRGYAFDLVEADMRETLAKAAPCEVVTAFCSLYYLPEDDMPLAVRRAAELAPVFVVQAKDDTRAAAADDKARKSASSYLAALLRANGFPEVEIHAPPGYSRPLLVGRREAEGR